MAHDNPFLVTTECNEVEAETFAAARSAAETLFGDCAHCLDAGAEIRENAEGETLLATVTRSPFGDGFTTHYFGTRTNASIEGRYR